ncbi:acid protease [Fomitiporia mediterranea MF3/22]|uniref:acid protease n=1 Tax=Fomitiporia mediterranea (strain MF3/22) TaxID=694068 RepID=UPI0004408DDE|nr:acid protease [Fomitiporia mediterranea MF3/22]EJD07493.1 acid protease [Fomitiporia mediterranea MF3/22]
MDHANAQDPNTADSTNLLRRASTINVTNTAVTYTTTVGVGSPATDYNLLIDTGSSNTWVGAGKPYSQTSSSKATGGSITVNYGSGKIVGIEYTDTVSLSDSLVIDKQMIGVATLASGVSDGVDGILGLGPVALTSGTVTGSQKVPTVADNLYAQKKIKSEVIGISYNPTTTTGNKNGELTFGDIDKSKYTGDITYASITKSSPAKNYWGIDQSITYGSSGQNILSSTAGIVDTGTTLTLLASDAFSRYESATGATLDGKTGLLKITNDQYEKLQSLYFNIGNTKFELTANAQIWPRALNKFIGGSSDGIYLVIADLGSNSGKGLDFINGYSFLERFYSVYDTTNNRVGIANTANTKVTVN